MIKALLLLGTNLGDKKQNLQNAIRILASDNCVVKKQSSVYETQPWGLAEQPSFYNMCLLIETDSSPKELLTMCKKAEAHMNSVKEIKWGPRILDIDILFYENEIVQSAELNIPHLLLQERNFALIPLSEIAPDWLHPVYKKNVAQLIEICPDTSAVKMIKDEI